jgi:hypothetical protein
VKFFSAVELIWLLADRDWLDEATKTIGQFWRRKNARRKVLRPRWPRPTVKGRSCKTAKLVKRPVMAFASLECN